MSEHSPEQERAREIAERRYWSPVYERWYLHLNSRDAATLGNAHLALLAAYEDRSAAFERAAADCVRLEGALEEVEEVFDRIHGAGTGHYEEDSSIVHNSRIWAFEARNAVRAVLAATPKPVADSGEASE